MRIFSMKSVMTHSFSNLPRVNINRSVFDRSHGHKTTFDVGDLIPFFWDEILPGDSISLKPTALIRMTTPLHPIMDNMFADVFFFSVPNRLLWQNWQKFCGERINPDDSIDYIIPTINFTANIAEDSIFQYLGLPIGQQPSNISSLPFRAMNLIYNEWFRDQNLQDSLVVNTDDGPDDDTDYSIQKRGKRHDYFTSSLPWLQKGDSVSIPLGQNAPVVTTDESIIVKQGTSGFDRNLAFGGTLEYSGGPSDGNSFQPIVFGGSSTTGDVRFGSQTGLEADLTSATAATINQLRQASSVQRLLEKDARSGTRYTEILMAHFGVTSPDSRVQRPEYLGGTSAPINITPIAQTSSTDATTPQANLAAIGTSFIEKNRITKSFVEHCQLIGFINVRADLTYQQGIDKSFTRSTRYDFYWPELAHIGEQAVFNSEIYYQGTSADDDVFGYQERYAEYRYKQSRITGRFNSLSAAPLDSWHLSEEFSSLPTLSDTFIKDNTPLDRALAVSNEPNFLAECFFHYKHVRPMPVYGIPGYGGRF
ncbi:putative major capsid protein [Eel River basin pequenovirus]|nr:putative major capsid protein [Eel River basin pequenovirus]